MNLWLCNYYGMCDSSGKAVGHSVKVTDEYGQILQDAIGRVSLIASSCIVKGITADCFDEIVELDNEIVVDTPFTFARRISDKIKIWNNLKKCFLISGDTLFFYQVDFFFFLYILTHKLPTAKRIYALIYHSNFTGGILEPILNKICRAGMNKLSGVFYTNHGNVLPDIKSVWIPDYYYMDEKYGYFFSLPKEEKCVCLGTMNRYKQIEEIVKLFSKTNYRLEIVGRFDDKERYNRIKNAVENSSNITVEDTILEDYDYYAKMGKSKYNILPYDMNQYINRTSGVLQEVIFVGSIPIAPNRLLDYNSVKGIGYDSIEDVDVEKLYDDSLSNMLLNQRNDIINKYSRDCIKNKMIELLKG